jgi:hypothetical protein
MATKITRVLRVKAKAHKASTRHVKARPAGREPAFVVSGAPSEPTGTPSLSTHARRLAAWIKRHPSASDAHVRHYLSEHAWITTGARFGWSGGAQALKTLIRVDRQAEHLWGLGASNRKVAEQTLRFVRAHSG